MGARHDCRAFDNGRPKVRHGVGDEEIVPTLILKNLFYTKYEDVWPFKLSKGIFGGLGLSDGRVRGATRGDGGDSRDSPHFLAGEPQRQRENSNSDSGKNRPDFWLRLTRPFYAGDYDAFANGAVIVIGGFLISLLATVFATRRNQQ